MLLALYFMFRTIIFIPCLTLGGCNSSHLTRFPLSLKPFLGNPIWSSSPLTLGHPGEQECGFFLLVFTKLSLQTFWTAWLPTSLYSSQVNATPSSVLGFGSKRKPMTYWSLYSSLLPETAYGRIASNKCSLNLTKLQHSQVAKKSSSFMKKGMRAQGSSVGGCGDWYSQDFHLRMTEAS